MPTTYTKLNSGEWGIRSTTALHAGRTVTVTKRDGSTKTETVVKVLSSANGAYVATISKSAARPAPARPARKYDDRMALEDLGIYDDF